MKKILLILAVMVLTLSLFGCKPNYLRNEQSWDPDTMLSSQEEESYDEFSIEESSEEASVAVTIEAPTKTKPVLGREWSQDTNTSEDTGPARVIEFLNLPASFNNNTSEDPGGPAPAATVLSCEMNKNGSIAVFIRKDSGHTSTFRVTYRFLGKDKSIVSGGLVSVDYTVSGGATTEQIILERDVPETAVYLEFTGLA